jgi:hypothetical protein
MMCVARTPQAEKSGLEMFSGSYARGEFRCSKAHPYAKKLFQKVLPVCNSSYRFHLSFCNMKIESPVRKEWGSVVLSHITGIAL